MADVMTPYGKLSFTNLFEPRATMDGKGDPRYSTNLIIPPKQQETQAYKDLQEAIIACAEEKFGKDWRKKNLRMPIRKGSEREYEGYDDDTIFINPWTKNKPGVVDREGNPILVPGDVWPGQVARLSVRPFAYENSGNKGVALALNHVQIVIAEAPRLDGRKSAADTFKEAPVLTDIDASDFGIDPAIAASSSSKSSGNGLMDDLMD
jgi:hypothetical protein